MPFKYIVFPAPFDPVDISVDGDKVTIRSKAPVKGVVLDVEGDEVKWSDQSTSNSPIFCLSFKIQTDDVASSQVSMSCLATLRSSQLPVSTDGLSSFGSTASSSEVAVPGALVHRHDFLLFLLHRLLRVRRRLRETRSCIVAWHNRVVVKRQEEDTRCERARAVWQD